MSAEELCRRCVCVCVLENCLVSLVTVCFVQMAAHDLHLQIEIRLVVPDAHLGCPDYLVINVNVQRHETCKSTINSCNYACLW